MWRFGCMSPLIHVLMNLSGGDKVWGGGWGNPVQGTRQALPMGPQSWPVEGTWHRWHQDPLSPDQTFLPNPDETRAGAEGLCQPHHLTGDGAQTHECFCQCTNLDCHRLCRYSYSADAKSPLALKTSVLFYRFSSSYLIVFCIHKEKFAKGRN